MSLKEYHRKRDFNQTAEPEGKELKKTKNKLLYLVQKHAASHLHYDFRLELSGVLKSWAVPKGPSLDPKIKHLAVHVEDHPIEYANFEGIIPKGQYGGGTVMIWDKGYWEPVDENVLQAYQEGNLTFELHGKKLHGRWKLIRTKGGTSGKEQWLLFKLKDEYSRSEAEFDVTEQETKSVTTGRSLKEIAQESDRVWTQEGEVKQHSQKKIQLKKKRTPLKLSGIKGIVKEDFPAFISPELATLVSEAPKGENWLHEIKWDGYRIHIQINKNKINLLTRRNKNWTEHFPGLIAAIKKANLPTCILDGELVALNNDNKADFQLLQNSLEETVHDSPLIFYAFDLLYVNGYSLLQVPLLERKKLLQTILTPAAAIAGLKYNDHILGKGEQVFSNACQYDLEGIVSKRVNSLYLSKRTKDWLKVKCTRRQEFVIGGYTDPKSSRQYFGALLLGYFDSNKNFIFCGRVGTGFTQASLKEIATILKKYQQDKSPYSSFPEKNTKNIHWVRPVVVAEIDYMEMTAEGILRHPSFKGLREDKKAQEVTLERPKDMKKIQQDKVVSKQALTKKTALPTTIKFSNLNKVLYPELGITKQELINYYESVAHLILPHIQNRPLTLVRCPHGSGQKCFYQKHFNSSVPDTLKQVDIMEKEKEEPYIYLNDLDGILGLVQMGVLEIHPWGSQIKEVEKPDCLIFDLDPSEEIAWSAVVEGAFLVHQFFDSLGLRNFVKTTGGKGLHVVIPIKPTLEWNIIHDICKRIADLIVELEPKKYLATMSKEKRKGKIFIDYLRNARGATAIGPYSTRTKPKATIAVPLHWDELSTKLKSDSFTLENINKRLKSLKTDPWEDFFKTRQSITTKIRKSLGM